MTTVMRILRYLKGTSSRGILFRKNDHLDLLAYTDADQTSERDDKRSISDYFTLVGTTKLKAKATKGFCSLTCRQQLLATILATKLFVAKNFVTKTKVCCHIRRQLDDKIKVVAIFVAK